MGHACCPAKQKLGFKFAKYHGNANDFIIVDLDALCATEHVEKTVHWFCENATFICDRNLGIGADGIILVEQSETHLAIRVINADGSLAKNCGNGLRCVARWYFERVLQADKVMIKLGDGEYEACKNGHDVTVLMGNCVVKKCGDVRFSGEDVGAAVFQAHLGNDHLVFLLDRWPKDLPVLLKEAQEKLEPGNFNMNFTFRGPDGQIFSQVYEHGVGFTQSCGSGACASASALALNDNVCAETQMELNVLQPGGFVQVALKQGQSSTEGSTFSLRQTGEAIKVFDGQGEFTF